MFVNDRLLEGHGHDKFFLAGPLREWQNRVKHGIGKDCGHKGPRNLVDVSMPYVVVCV